MFPDFPQRTAGIAYGHHILRNVFCDNAAGTDDRIFPDGNTRDNDSSRTYPYIFADMDWLIVLHGFFAKSWIDGVVRCGNGYIRSEHDFVININVPIVHQCEIEIGIHTVSEMNIFSIPVCTKWKLNIAVLSALGKHFLI